MFTESLCGICATSEISVGFWTMRRCQTTPGRSRFIVGSLRDRIVRVSKWRRRSRRRATRARRFRRSTPPVAACDHAGRPRGPGGTKSKETQNAQKTQKDAENNKSFAVSASFCVLLRVLRLPGFGSSRDLRSHEQVTPGFTSFASSRLRDKGLRRVSTTVGPASWLQNGPGDSLGLNTRMGSWRRRTVPAKRSHSTCREPARATAEPRSSRPRRAGTTSGHAAGPVGPARTPPRRARPGTRPNGTAAARRRPRTAQ